MTTWMKAIVFASLGISRNLTRQQSFEILRLVNNNDDINSGDTKNKNYSSSSSLGQQVYDMQMITSAYRRAALRSHPDKTGGDTLAFKQVQDAYAFLSHHYLELEKLKAYDAITVEVLLEKGGPGVGLGMKVIENRNNGYITIKEVLPCILIKYISDNAMNGKLQLYDCLIMIDNENVTNWPLLRIIQRLNDFRVPIGKTVKLFFTRQV